MKYKTKSILLWIFAVLFMTGIAIYQRLTGPTHPVRGKVNIENNVIKYKLLTSYGGEDDATLSFEVADESIEGKFIYKRFKSHDEWSEVAMQKDGENMIAKIPHQPPAGKIIYKIILTKNNKNYTLTEEPVIIRFKGGVPDYVLIPHILFMFLAMVFSLRTGFEALIKGHNAFNYTRITFFALLIGGLILGPIIQKFAFGAFWTGWPFGHDLTDNKTIVAFIFWLIAFINLYKNKEKRGWALVASIVLLAVYLIPHSVLGSEIDYTAIKN